MIIAALQVRARLDFSKASRKIGALVREAVDHGARLVALPEYALWHGSPRSMLDFSRHYNESLDILADLARAHKIFLIIGGLIHKRDPADSKAWNESILFGPDGAIVALYRKRNLFKASINGRVYGEPEWTIPGHALKVAPVDSWRVGFAVCFDLRFSDHFRKLRAMGADLIVTPSAFIYETGKAHWSLLARARAVETQSYLLAPALAGASEGTKLYGHSMIIDPWGRIGASLKSATAEGVATLKIERDRVDETRSAIPLGLKR